MSGTLCKKDWGKGPVSAVHNAIDVTTTSSEIDLTGFNAVLVSVLITGSGTWKIDLQGRFNTDGTVTDIYDNNDNQLTTGNLSANRMKLFVAIPDLIKIVATEISGTATCTVRLQPLNV
jgi:hypothetical protein